MFNLDGHEATYLQLWSPTVMARPVIRRIALKVPGHSFRYAVEGAGLIQLYLDGQRDGAIHHTHTLWALERGGCETAIRAFGRRL